MRDAFAAGKIIASICQGPIPVAAAIDGEIVTGRTPPEVPEFVDAITEALLR